MSRKARLVIEQTSPVGADQRLYKLEPGGELPEFVLVSAVNALFSGDETFIFAANASGEVTDWTELLGSFKGERNHEKALRGAGYEVAP